MKKISLLLVVIMLVVSCAKTGGAPASVPESPVTKTVKDALQTQPKATTALKWKRPIVKKLPTDEEHKKNVLHCLQSMETFETKTDIKVKTSGGSFLMPDFEVTVNKHLKHRDSPLSTHVTILTKGPFFLDLGPEKFEMYTEGDQVFSYDEKSKTFIPDRNIKASLVRNAYDVETIIQEKLWNNQKMSLQNKDTLQATLQLKGEDARKLSEEIFSLYGIGAELEPGESEEYISVSLLYDKKTYHPKEMLIEGTTHTQGYRLDIRILATYSNIKSSL